MSWTPKIGEEVEVVENFSLAGKIVNEKSALLEPGDRVIVHWIDFENEEISYIYGSGLENFLSFKEVKPIAKNFPKKECDCDIMVLMNVGCKCGSIIKE